VAVVSPPHPVLTTEAVTNTVTKEARIFITNSLSSARDAAAGGAPVIVVLGFVRMA
jgi:hypothetical protein